MRREALVLVCSAVIIVATTLRVWPSQAQDTTGASGAALFAERCATCHGADARGRNGPNLTDGRQHILVASGTTLLAFALRE